MSRTRVGRVVFSKMHPDRVARHQRNNAIQSFSLVASMALLLALVGWALFGPVGIAWTAALGAGLVLFAPKVSPKVLMRMYNARFVTPDAAPDLHHMLNELSKRAELTHVPQLYYLPSPVMNAFTTGRPSEAAIAVSDGLLRRLTPRELMGVLAHELSHVANNDMRVMALADGASRITSLLPFLALILVVSGAAFGLRGGILTGLLLLVAPTVMSLIQLALSRSREYDADLDAVTLTGDPEGLAAALRKIEHQQGGLIERVLLPGRKVPDPSILRTHPATQDRIDRLLALDERPAEQPALSFAQMTPQQVIPDGVLGPVRRLPRWRVTGLWY